MGARKLSRWQKASALVPMSLLVVAWGAAISNTGLATASDRVSADDIPDVPATAFEQPASVQAAPPGVDSRAGASGTLATLSTNGIPTAALSAYRRAEELLGKADPSCNLPWHLVAAIGRVESNHGRTGGNALDAKGVAKPGIYGIPLDGREGIAEIRDTDNGGLDDDAVYDRAVGPMQFIPGTWRSVGVDADGDGKKDPQNINDAATAAAIYLCSGSGDLSTQDGAAAAVRRYNNSSEYVDLVLGISKAYASGDFTATPNGTSTGSVLTSRSFDQTLTPAQRRDAAKQERKVQESTKKPRGGSSSSGGSSGGTSGGSTGGSGSSSGGSSGGGSTGGSDGSGSTGGGSTGGSGGGSTVGGAVQGAVKDTPLAPITKPVTDLLSATEANLRCAVEVSLLPVDTHAARFKACMDKYTKG
ncbi:lytic transglycosylase domain-containing protein [Aeromicrobium sp.]|uniref:lytic transglycosylase domain-containing protein n=1 Tax=Aeromicrobium sp. TaxID=1871063 RepID=UPI00351593B6